MDGAHRIRKARRLAAAVATFLIASLAALACVASPRAALAEAASETHTLNFRNADIVAFIEDISALTGYTLIVHPEVRGNVTVTSQAQLTRDQVFEVFLATLRTYGYTAIQTAPGTYRIMPETAAAQNSGAVGSADVKNDEFITEVFSLKHFDATEAARMVTPLVNHRGQVSASASNNLLIVVDYAGNIGRIRQIIADLDKDRSVVRTITLENASARDVVRVVNGLEQAKGPGDAVEARVQAVALEGSSSLVLRGDPSGVERAAAMVSSLDVASAPTESLRVISLKNARAADVAPTLEKVARTLRPASDPQHEISVPVDEASNSVVLTADPQTVAALARVVDQLDVRRPQVQIEAIIVEIGQGVARDLGVQYVIAGNHGTIPFAATNFSQSAPNLLAITGALIANNSSSGGASVSDDVKQAAINSILGTAGGIFGVGGSTSDGLFGAILNALQQDSESNVLSTPHVTTLDNEAAHILVGQNIPITTGEALGADLKNTFRQIQRQDIGVKLTVTPQITEGDAIKLKITQEVSSIADNVNGEFVTNKREIDTTVLADDGGVVVLGGLMEGTEKSSTNKVPLLGSIPLVGHAFSSTSHDRERTNLVVFLRTTIVRDAAGSRALAQGTMRDLATTQSARNTPASDRFDALLRQALGKPYGAQ
jgi:general secretion pathway protein D